MSKSDEITCIFAVIRELQERDGFATDCIHSQPGRSPPLSAGDSGKSARNADIRRMSPSLRVSDWASLSPSRASVSDADFWYLALEGACGIVCRRAEGLSILLTDLATCFADQPPAGDNAAI